MLPEIVIACCLLIVTVLAIQTIPYRMTENNPCQWKSSNDFDKVFFVPRHSTDTNSTIRAINLHNPVLDAEFCFAMTPYANHVLVERSNFLTTIVIPKNCHINSLEVITTALKQIEFEQNNYIRKLVVRTSDLRVISPTIRKLANLAEARFQFCKLEYLDLSLFCSLTNIQKLDLFRNNITTVRGIASDAVCQSALQVIKLNENKVRVLRLDLFAPFKKLVWLDLTSNMLESLQGSLANPALETLILSHNQLTVVDMCKWSKPNKMLELHVSFNNLTAVPLCLEALGEVTYVDLRFNYIRQVEVQALNALPKLECINLTYNNITSIPLDESLYSPVLKVLQVHDNPLGNITIPVGTFNRLKVVLESQRLEFV
ncbi:insulin-like growth factor-binding protein complex acid labile subunit [Anopheles stephensi]|uniref:insulin-like growth factor-binding protein complex acid labile subunit n=1 Tax=Anopheles stephensi TaxID=30069 RepID=UPI0016589B37|nr:insulin-like growth factor-binding protein complex acid labile subunit [Anopheles stephensi]